MVHFHLHQFGRNLIFQNVRLQLQDHLRSVLQLHSAFEAVGADERPVVGVCVRPHVSAFADDLRQVPEDLLLLFLRNAVEFGREFLGEFSVQVHGVVSAVDSRVLYAHVLHGQRRQVGFHPFPGAHCYGFCPFCFRRDPFVRCGQRCCVSHLFGIVAVFLFQFVECGSPAFVQFRRQSAQRKGLVFLREGSLLQHFCHCRGFSALCLRQFVECLFLVQEFDPLAVCLCVHVSGYDLP